MMLRLWLHTPDVRPNSEGVHCPTILVQHGKGFQRHHHLTQLTALSCAHCKVKLYTPALLSSVAPSTTATSHVYVRALSTLLTRAPPTTAIHPSIQPSSHPLQSTTSRLHPPLRRAHPHRSACPSTSDLCLQHKALRAPQIINGGCRSSINLSPLGLHTSAINTTFCKAPKSAL